MTKTSARVLIQSAASDRIGACPKPTSAAMTALRQVPAFQEKGLEPFISSELALVDCTIQ